MPGSSPAASDMAFVLGPRGPGRLAAWRPVTAIVLLVVSAGLVIALHPLRPGLDPWAHRMSEYSTGPYWFLMVGAFVALGVGLMTVPRRSAAERVLLAVAGVGMVVSAVF